MSWQPIPSAPGIATGHTYVSDGVKLYSLGGVDDQDYSVVGVVQAYDPANVGWSTLHPLPSPISYAVAAVLGGKIYLIGGYGTRYAPSTAVYVYDPADDAAGWSTMHPLPSNTNNNAAIGFDGKIYITQSQYQAGMYVYDPANDAFGWSSLLGAPPAGGGYFAASGTKLYYTGGNGPHGGVANAYSYDSTAGWVAIAPLPAVGMNFTAFSEDGRLWAAIPNPAGGQSTTFYSYSPADDAAGWRTENLLSPTASRSGHGGSLSRIGDFIYFADGNPTAARNFAATPSGRLYPTLVSGSTQMPGFSGLMPSEFDIYPDRARARTGITVHLTRVATRIYPEIVYTETYFDTDIKLDVTAAPVPPFTLSPVAGHTAVAAALTITHPALVVVPVTPGVVAGSTVVAISTARTVDLIPTLVAGSTTVAVLPPGPVVELQLDLVYSQNTTAVSIAQHGIFELDVVAGRTTVRIAAPHLVGPDVAGGSTAVAVALLVGGEQRLFPDTILGSTLVRVIAYPASHIYNPTTTGQPASNTPILLSLSLSARLEPQDLLVSA